MSFKKNQIHVLFLSISIFIACESASHEKSNFMSFDNVEFVTEFPETFLLQDKSVPNIDIIGVRNFTIYDSLLILNTTNNNGLWSFYSLPNYLEYGSFLKRGEGPLEFMQGPSASTKSKITKENGEFVAYLYDFQKGRLLKLNISESIATNKQHLSILNDDLPPFMFDFIAIDSSNYFIKRIENSNTQQLRYLLKNGKETKIPVLEKLNQASISPEEDFNILSTITRFNTRNNIYLETPVGLNYVNIYSLDGTITKTICIGKYLFDISKIENENRWDRIYTFANSAIFNDFFGVIFINEEEKSYQTNRTRLPSIFLFNWEGKPLAELKFENHITSFDIDFLNQELYTLDVHSDEFFKYDISEVLAKLK